jgi:hypothetical protein
MTMREIEYKRPVITDWNDLGTYGLNCLTGEACAYGERLLFDVNDVGRKFLADYFSCPEMCLAPNWNSKINGVPATGSIMLCRELFGPLARFALYHVEQVDYIVALPGGGFHGYMTADVPPDEWRDMADYQVRLNWSKNTNQPSQGGRNVHAFSGRTK